MLSSYTQYMEGLSQYQKDMRPWGVFERFTLEETTTVKILTVKAGEAFSLQTHAQRDEFWRIISGQGIVTIGEKHFNVQPGESFFAPHGTPHRAEGGASDLVMLEISFGSFDEQDITRLEDRYGRN
jgi:mannose-6-phosphate isomerase-like protein (cupin superfamily)